MVRPTGAYSLLIITGVTGFELQVTSYEGGHSVGKISKQWAGTLREIFTDADYFGKLVRLLNCIRLMYFLLLHRLPFV